MKRYDSGIDDLSLELMQNYINNNIDDNISFSNKVKNIINKIKNKLGINKSNLNEENNKNDFNTFIMKKYNKKFFNEEYEELLKCAEETKDEKKFREAVQKQQYEYLNDINKPLNVDQTMKQLVYELDIITDAYNLPELSITNKEWEIYFKKVFKFFTNHGIETKYYEYMRSVIRYMLAKVLVKDNIEIGKNEFIEGLDYLKVCEEFDDEEINNLQNELNIILKNHKITNLNDYKRRLIKN